MGKHGKYWALVGVFATTLILLAVPANATPCRQALALGLDVSGSVDAREYRLQLDGLAAALSNTQVRDALLTMPHTPVRLAIYEWSAPGDQRVILPWTDITDSAALEAITRQITAITRAPFGPSTALGMGMIFGGQLLASQGECWRRTLDISGDGRSNTGPRPQDVRDLAGLAGITVNALVVGTGGEAQGNLSAYFKTLVIQGLGAFTEQADSFAAYEQAMVKKLLRELQGAMVSELVLRP